MIVHHTSVEAEEAAKPYYAECICGYSGPARRTYREASDDALTHVEDAKRDREKPTYDKDKT